MAWMCEAFYNEALHSVISLTLADVVTDLRAFIEELNTINPSALVILSISSDGTLGEAGERSALDASVYEKSVLRVAAEVIVSEYRQVSYFPLYDITTDPRSRKDYLAAGKRSITAEGYDRLTNLLLGLPANNSDSTSEHRLDSDDDATKAAYLRVRSEIKVSGVSGLA